LWGERGGDDFKGVWQEWREKSCGKKGKERREVGEAEEIGRREKEGKRRKWKGDEGGERKRGKVRWERWL